jgi:hypothetical protein
MEMPWALQMVTTIIFHPHFQGVGGWESKGVDSGIYSKKFMEMSKSFYESAIRDAQVDPIAILDYAWKYCQYITGSSTACVVVLESKTGKLKYIFFFEFMVTRYQYCKCGRQWICNYS